jgi:hypothetical protein
MLICRVGDATGYAEFWNMLVLMPDRRSSSLPLAYSRSFRDPIASGVEHSAAKPSFFLPILNSNSEQRGR